MHEKEKKIIRKRMRGSNKLIGVINLLTFLLSIPILVSGGKAGNNTTECLKFLQWPLIGIGVSMMVTSLAGLVGACCRKTLLMTFYFVVMLLILLFLVGFIIFAYAVTPKGSGREIQNRAYLEYYLQDYEGWLEKHVVSGSYWTKISSCLRDSNACHGLPLTADIFYHTKLTPIQSGCCKPQTECGYVYENATVWSPGEGEGSNPVPEADCSRWSNDQYLLCYDCDSCKAGVLATLKITWRKISLVNIVSSAALFILYIPAYALYKNNRKTNHCGPCGQPRMTKAQPP